MRTYQSEHTREFDDNISRQDKYRDTNTTNKSKSTDTKSQLDKQPITMHHNKEDMGRQHFMEATGQTSASERISNSHSDCGLSQMSHKEQTQTFVVGAPPEYQEDHSAAYNANAGFVLM